MRPVDDPARRQLLAAKLRALVKGAGTSPSPDAVLARVPNGAAALIGGDGAGWYLIEDEPRRALGAALVWTGRNPTVSRWHLVVADPGAAALHALRLAAFTSPPALFTIDGTELITVAVPPLAEARARADRSAPFRPDEYLRGLPPGAREPVGALLDALRGHDAIVAEHDAGALVLTVRGLEVARVALYDGQAVVEVGVGKHDRAAHREIAGIAPLETTALARDLDAIDRAARAVLERRRGDAPEHQLQHLRAERWLRARIISDPALAGLPAATSLEPVEPPVPVDNLVQTAVAVAIADDTVVVSQIGMDLDLVPSAAHAWLRASRDAHAPPRLVVVVPARDDHPINRALLARLDPELRATLHVVGARWMD